jgi:hypothetical protein
MGLKGLIRGMIRSKHLVEIVCELLASVRTGIEAVAVFIFTWSDLGPKIHHAFAGMLRRVRLIFYFAGNRVQSFRATEVPMGLHESNILAKMARINISRQALSLLVGISESVLSRGLMSTRPLSSADILRLDKTLSDLIEIQRIILPLELPTSDVGRLKVLLNKFRDDGLDRIMNEEIIADLRARIEQIANIR